MPPDGLTSTEIENRSDEYIFALSQILKTKIIPIGLIKYGVCRHVSAVFKFVCDFLEIPCILIRGTTCSGGGHIWNLVKVDKEWWGIDVRNFPGELLNLSELQKKKFIRSGTAHDGVGLTVAH